MKVFYTDVLHRSEWLTKPVIPAGPTAVILHTRVAVSVNDAVAQRIVDRIRASRRADPHFDSAIDAFVNSKRG